MEAEREKRAEITNSEGFRQARINESEGERLPRLISEVSRQKGLMKHEEKQEIELLRMLLLMESKLLKPCKEQR